MLPKVLMLVCLLPLALCHGGESKEMVDMMEEMGGDMSMFEKMKDYMEEKKEHYEGDGDCKSKQEAEMKQWSMMKRFQEVQKMQEMKEKMEKMEKMKEMKEKMEKAKKFHMFMEQMEQQKKAAAMEQKKKMYELWQKHEEMQKRKAKEGEFKELIESFQEQKHQFAFQLTHAFLQLCQCGEVNAQMNKMFMGLSTNEETDMMGMEGGLREAMEAMETGDMASLAEKIKKMDREQQKKLFMGGLVKSMCGGAKAYVMQAKRFEETYMQTNSTMEMTTTA